MKKEKNLKGFVRNGQKLNGVMYKSENVIVHVAKEGNKAGELVVLGSGYSLSVDEHNRIIEHDPLMIWPDVSMFSENTRVISIFYPFECKGLAVAGKELTDYLNQFKFGTQCIFIGHSKCGACFANMAKWLENRSVIVTISAAFHGTPVADLEFQMRLSGVARWLYDKIFSNHQVDQDICLGSSFLETADYTGLNEHYHINVTSVIGNEITLNPITLFLRYLDTKGVHGDGIVPVKSQEIYYENTIRYRISATHANSLRIGIECVKEFHIHNL